MSDAFDVLRWRNDPRTRAMSLDDGVIEEADHVAWFQRALADADRLILIGEDEGLSIGMVRFDRGAGGWEVSINVAPEARAQGRGRRLLLEGLDAFAAERPGEPIEAVIRAGNTASVRLFEAAGFSRCEERSGLLRYRRPAA